MNYDMVTDILPFSHAISEALWDHTTVTLAGSPFASAPHVPSSGLPKFRPSAQRLAQVDDSLIESTSVCVRTRIENLVAGLNARAMVSVERKKSTIVVCALNKAASNTLRAFASLIRSEAFEFYSVSRVEYIL